VDDRAAFLRAIADQPADRTARLAFADFLEETGGVADVARAGFVRAQVEAETVHPNSNRAADLDARARALFAAHWIDWWRPVCAAVGLPEPYRPGSETRGWFARLFAAPPPKPDFPYSGPYPLNPFGTYVEGGQPGALASLTTIQFAGGFPEALTLSGSFGATVEILRRWSGAAPLARLELRNTAARDWPAIDGPHLNGLRSLELGYCVDALLDAVGRSPHLSRIEELRLALERSNSVAGLQPHQALAATPLVGRVKRLSVELAVPAEPRALAAGSYENLTALDVRVHRPLDGEPDPTAAANLLLEMLRSARPDRLEELTLDAVTSAAVWRPEWPRLPRLRRLELQLPIVYAGRAFPAADLFPALTDLTVSFWGRGHERLDALAAWPRTAQLCHLRLNAGRVILPRAVPALLRLVQALDPARLETLRIISRVCDADTVRRVFAERFGDRVRFG
jgi:uncharacterized protein (TIGR02996 family)